MCPQRAQTATRSCESRKSTAKEEHYVSAWAWLRTTHSGQKVVALIAHIRIRQPEEQAKLSHF